MPAARSGACRPSSVAAPASVRMGGAMGEEATVKVLHQPLGARDTRAPRPRFTSGSRILKFDGREAV